LLFLSNDTATSYIYTLSLHDALPISEFQGLLEGSAENQGQCRGRQIERPSGQRHHFIEIFANHWRIGCEQIPSEGVGQMHDRGADRKSTRLNSSHVAISYAVFCLKKK